MLHSNNDGMMVVPMERVLIVDDHSLVRDGLRSLLEISFPDCDILEAAALSEAVAALQGAGEVDMILLDLNIPDVSRFSGLSTLRDGFPSIPVVMVSGALDRATVREALAAGAAGFIPKSLKRSEIIDALKQVLEGEIYIPGILEQDSDTAREEASILGRIETLTPQQKVVLRHLVNGKLNKQIAFELDVSMTTVKAHVSAILSKFSAYSRTQVVILANRVGFH
ncbi:response regulator transcription factor [Novosphingobium sp. FSW06-99]|uniref:response regulator transcription factor n=1 Tax=Novosphingobium sp. FSW06-99 TaxID=1739113 RepID=UPI000A7A5DA1|nr:response regulator transcription factor [Novosphingobium sp. FSW06-99]